MPVSNPIDLEQLIEQANSLEPLPASAVKLAAILAQEDWDLDDVTPVISLDQGLVGKVLSAANSVAGGARDQVVTVEQAVIRLGAGTVLAIGIGSGVKKSVSVELPEYGLSEDQLWKHSVAAAVVADGIRGYTRRKIPLESSTAALLHDIGKLILARHLDPGLLHYLESAREIGGLSEQRAEMEILGVNHAELGGLIAQHWQLPPVIAEGITYHHNPAAAYCAHEESLIAHVVYLSNEVAKFVTGDRKQLPEDTAMMGAAKIRLGLARGEYREMCVEMRDRFEEVAKLYG
jgi:HD-like signal output (HDOD) protein